LGVLCDRQRVLQVFSNLIGNAIKFTPAGGEIAIDVKADADQVRFAVSDSGPGIPQADLAHIFDRYWQRRETARRGTGLGLFIAKALVEGHHGRIWCESQIGKGSTFYFTLPRSDAAVAQNETERSSPKY
jgi:signal transduction histidine kinase